MMKRTLTLLFVGIGLGLVASMWFGPGMIAWWFRPPGQVTGGLAQMCGDQVLAATEQLVRMQLIAGASLGVVIAIVGNLVARKKAKDAGPTPGPTVPPVA